MKNKIIDILSENIEQLDKEDAVPAREQEAQDLQIQNQYIHLYHRMYGYY